MLAAVPSLRAFAISLSGNVEDDLVQETLVRAIANINSFHPGTNMSAWLITILRNLFRSEYRKRRRKVEDASRRRRTYQIGCWNRYERSSNAMVT
jgi:RNA polymerase sigma-70 factor, ECF subfamily